MQLTMHMMQQQLAIGSSTPTRRYSLHNIVWLFHACFTEVCEQLRSGAAARPLSRVLNPRVLNLLQERGRKEHRRARLPARTASAPPGAMVAMDEAAMGEAWTKLHDGANPTNYILFGYVSRTTIGVVATGSDGFERLAAQLKPDQIQFGGFSPRR